MSDDLFVHDDVSSCLLAHTVRISLPRIRGAASIHHMVEVSTVLVDGHAVSYFEHIRVVPMARAGIFAKYLPAGRESVRTLLKLFSDVACRTPRVTYLACPFPRLVRAPFAEAEIDRTAGFA
jgi:hypothetical protein